MKILITTDLYKATVNGVVTSVKNLERELLSQGHDVRILTTSSDYVSRRAENVYYIKSLPLQIYPDVRVPVSKAEDFMQEIIEWKPEVVHSQCEFFTFGYAKKVAAATGAALVHTYHTLYEQYTEYLPVVNRIGRQLLGRWMNFRLTRVKTIIAPTAKVERTLKEYGIQNDIEIIPTGIALEYYQQKADEEWISERKSIFGISEDSRIILSLGRLGYEKRVDEVLRGFANLCRGGNEEAILLIVGDGPARVSLGELAEELGIRGRVKFAGMASPEEVRGYYQMADVFVCASTSETQGLTYIEAAANGLPLVCREDPCLQGVLESGSNGYTYAREEELTEKLAEVLSLGKEKFASAGRAKAMRFGTRSFAERVMVCYERAVWKGAQNHEGVIVCKEQENSGKEWGWACNGHAGRGA